jgi:hypothetical protein
VLIQGAELSELVSETEHWGPGYKQWDMGLTLRANIKRVYGTPDYFDVIMTCGGAGKYPSEFRKSRTVVTTRKHECREGEVCAKPLLEGANQGCELRDPGAARPLAAPLRPLCCPLSLTARAHFPLQLHAIS